MIDTKSLIQNLRRTRPEFDEAHAVVELVRNTGDMLQRMRERKGLSQIEVAAKLGVTPGRVSQLESGTIRNAPSLKTLAQFAKACDDTIDVRLTSDSASQSKSEDIPLQTLQKVLEELAALRQEVSGLREAVGFAETNNPFADTLIVEPEPFIPNQSFFPRVRMKKWEPGKITLHDGIAMGTPGYRVAKGVSINAQTAYGVELVTKGLKAAGCDYVKVDAKKHGADDHVELVFTFAQSNAPVKGSV